MASIVKQIDKLYKSKQDGKINDEEYNHLKKLLFKKFYGLDDGLESLFDDSLDDVKITSLENPNEELLYDSKSPKFNELGKNDSKLLIYGCILLVIFCIILFFSSMLNSRSF